VSRDSYQIDLYKHGGTHVDRYSPDGKLVGRYRLDGTAIPHKGHMPPAVPNSDLMRFQAEVDKLRQ